jgi:hypothetical protein
VTIKGVEEMKPTKEVILEFVKAIKNLEKAYDLSLFCEDGMSDLLVWDDINKEAYHLDGDKYKG